MRVSIVIPAYNAARFLNATVESVIAQSFTDWECMVVDDGSTDDTSEIASKLSCENSHVTIIHQANLGPAEARNRGFTESSPRTEYFLFLDHDDRLLPNALQRLVNLLDMNPAYIAAHGLALEVKVDANFVQVGDSRIRNSIRKEPTVSGLVNLGPDNQTTRASLIQDNWITTLGSILIRRSALAETGGFDTKMLPLDDWDMYFRLAQLGDIGFVDKPVIEWTVHGSNVSGNQEWMDIATCRVRRRMLESPNLTEVERQCAAERLAQASRSAFRHRSKSQFADALSGIKTGKLFDAGAKFAGAATSYMNYLNGRTQFDCAQSKNPLNGSQENH